ncbi:hypothetical protein PaG_01779 [Moesziomyces aphidis]|uniref:Uncharacterized protein n=1 Tax=Moesziomyces aphidis TaxID=84754 RepID=W3VP86_MOEAP|nr:hypothetical protein PaG_01779 [Moesziomyces aphidis]
MLRPSPSGFSAVLLFANAPARLRAGSDAQIGKEAHFGKYRTMDGSSQDASPPPISPSTACWVPRVAGCTVDASQHAMLAMLAMHALPASISSISLAPTLIEPARSSASKQVPA